MKEETDDEGVKPYVVAREPTASRAAAVLNFMLDYLDIARNDG